MVHIRAFDAIRWFNSVADTLKPLVDAAVAGRSAEGLARAVPKARVACLMRVAAEAEVAGDEGNQTRWLDLRQC